MTRPEDDELLGGFRFLDVSDQEGAGGQGTVRKAVCVRPVFPGLVPGTVVALKTMEVQDDDGTRYERLVERTERLVRLNHPNVVRYYGCFRERATLVDIHAVVLEYLEGETLKQRLSKEPAGLDADVVLSIATASVSALCATSAAGIVHRDIKPDNIFLCDDGGVKLIDFEIARQDCGDDATVSMDRAGSYGYMAPERLDVSFQGDEQSDVFSLAATLHEALAGRLPYREVGDAPANAEMAFEERWTQWARKRDGAVSPIIMHTSVARTFHGMAGVLEKALAPDRAERFAYFREFAAALGGVACIDLQGEKDTYRLLRLVGRGGFGEVFKARAIGSGETVAIKHLISSDAKAVKRFGQEAQIMAQIGDECFVRFIECFEAGHVAARQMYIVMAFLTGMPGNSLRDAIASAPAGRLPVGDVLKAFRRYAHGLAVLEAQRISHRDIKPSNLYYPRGEPERAAIMDLGIARDWEKTLTEATHSGGSAPGTPDYMPPEVVLNQSSGSAAADIFALGLCLYEALTGKMGYPRFKTGATNSTAAYLIRARKMRPPKFDDPLVTRNPDLASLLARMTEPAFERRMKSCAELELTLHELDDAFQDGQWTVPSTDEICGEGVPRAASDDATPTDSGDQTAEGTADSGDQGAEGAANPVAETAPRPSSRPKWGRRAASVLLLMAFAAALAWLVVRRGSAPAVSQTSVPQVESRLVDLPSDAAPSDETNAQRLVVDQSRREEEQARLALQLAAEREAKEKLEADLAAAKKRADELAAAEQRAREAQAAAERERAAARKLEEKRLAEEAEQRMREEERRRAEDAEKRRQEEARRRAEAARAAERKRAAEQAAELLARNLATAGEEADAIVKTYGEKGEGDGNAAHARWRAKWKGVLQQADFSALDAKVEVAHIERKNKDALDLQLAKAKLAATEVVGRFLDESVPYATVQGERAVWEATWRPQLPQAEYNRIWQLVADADANRKSKDAAVAPSEGVIEKLDDARLCFSDGAELKGLRLFAQLVKEGHRLDKDDVELATKGFEKFRGENLQSQDIARTRQNSNYNEATLKKELEEARECLNSIKGGRRHK